jgi:Polysaccharide pyruvyl transferase
MEAGTHHEIADLACEPGELSFTGRIGDAEQRVWLRTGSEILPTADAALCACLLPAMRFGGRLDLPAPLSPRLLRNQREFQAVQEAWSRSWEFDDFRLSEVEVRARERSPEDGEANGRVAALFSGGVDSWSIVLDEPELTDLIFVRGIDLIPRIPGNTQVADEVEARLRGAAEELGLAFHTVETNLRELSDPLAPWEAYFGCAVVSVALFLSPLFDRVLIAGDSDHEVQVDSGANRLVDQLWSTEGLEIVDAGGRYSRIERLRRIAGHPVVRRTLRTCWQNLDGAYNCGRCRKCLMTMVGLEALGAREGISTYPAELDLDAVAELEVTRPVSLCFWEDVLDATRAAGRADLEGAVEPVVASGKRALGLPLSYRRRARPGPPPTERSAAIAQPPPDRPPALFATPETAAAVSGARAVALLVGSYDGSGNYGDIAQLDAALGLLRRHDPGLPALPVLERAHLAGHEDAREGFVNRPDRALFFGPGEAHRDGLVPVRLPDDLASAALYLYGGGYLTRRWGERKLAMLRAAESLLAECGGGGVVRFATGLQAEPGWVAGLGPADALALGRFEPLGARDGESAAALAGLGPGARAPNTSDDALGVLGELPPAPLQPSANRLQINIHVAEHEWMTALAGGVAGFLAELLAELERAAGLPLVARPLIAYLDRHTEERASLERLRKECAARGVELTAPWALRLTSLADSAATLRRAALTLSSSYHVALTSLLLEVPAALIAGNEYYRQKAAGLAGPFGLSPAFAPDPDGDPAAIATSLAAETLDPKRREELHGRLAGGGRLVRERRKVVEEELLRRLAAAAPSADHEVADVEHRAGELSFTARVGGREQRVWMRAGVGAETSAEAVLPACLLPAMRHGGSLTIPVAISPRVLRTQREFQGIQRGWSRQWEHDDRPLSEVEVTASATVPAAQPAANGRVAAFFSGGVDSWSVLLEHPEITDLIFIEGFDLLPSVPRQAGLTPLVEHSLREAAGELGLRFHRVETNLRELSDPEVGWEVYCGCALDAVALFLGPMFERVLIAGDTDHETQVPSGISRLVDQLWSTERLEVVQAGGRHGRVERLRRVAGHAVVRRSLRVCWENRDGAYNCCRCRKCLITMIGLEALGVRGSFPTFPGELDLDLLAEAELTQMIQLVMWEDTLDAARAAGRIDLAVPVARLVARGKRNLGLPLSYRSRATPGPPPLRGYAGSGATAAPGRR